MKDFDRTRVREDRKVVIVEMVCLSRNVISRVTVLHSDVGNEICRDRKDGVR